MHLIYFSAPAATRELSEFIREVALSHDSYSKGKFQRKFLVIFAVTILAWYKISYILTVSGQIDR